MKNIFIAFLFISSTSNAQQIKTDNWKHFTEKTFFSSISYPPGWILDDEVAAGNGSYIIYAPEKKDKRAFRENVNMLTYYIPGTPLKMDVKDFAETNFSQLRKTLKDCQVLSNKYVTINGITMYMVACTGMAGAQFLYFKQLYCLDKGVGFMLSYTCEAGKKDPNSAISDAILASFKPAK